MGRLHRETSLPSQAWSPRNEKPVVLASAPAGGIPQAIITERMMPNAERTGGAHLPLVTSSEHLTPGTLACHACPLNAQTAWISRAPLA